ERQRLQEGNRVDHADMMAQLGITKLRSGRNANAGQPNAANYDQEKANPFPNWPELMVTKSGKKVTSAEQWWRERRPEIAEDFEREVVGRVPKNVPQITWRVAETVKTK